VVHSAPSQLTPRRRDAAPHGKDGEEGSHGSKRMDTDFPKSDAATFSFGRTADFADDADGG